MKNIVQNNYEEIKEITKRAEIRTYKLNAGDIMYCDQIAINKLVGYECRLKVNDEVYIKEGQMILPVFIVGGSDYINSNNVRAKITRVKKTKKYPEKKWWQIWLKQEEHIEGYYLMIM